MADMTEDELNAARGRISSVIDDLSSAIDDLRRLKDQNKLPRNYAKAQIDALRDRRSDYENLEASLSATTSVSSIPSDTEVEKLASAVAKLRVDNVVEAAARGAVNEIVTIVGTAAALGGEDEPIAPAQPIQRVSVGLAALIAAAALGVGALLLMRARR